MKFARSKNTVKVAIYSYLLVEPNYNDIKHDQKILPMATKIMKLQQI